jgi:hypothetical protein
MRIAVEGPLEILPNIRANRPFLVAVAIPYPVRGFSSGAFGGL